MIDEPLRAFLDRLASADPAPGGGSASAVAGAMAAALLAMVCRITRSGQDPALAEIAGAMDEVRATLLDLAVKDAEAFAAVMAAVRMPKATDEQRRDRQAAIQKALVGAASVPLAVARAVLRALAAAAPVARSGTPNALSDVAVSALLGHAAVHGALANVRINVDAIKDRAYQEKVTAEVTALGAQATALRDQAMEVVQQRWTRSS